MNTEILIMWAAVTLYALAAVLYVISFVFRKPKVQTIALALSVGGIAVHAAGIAVRWMRVGHGPFLGFYEVVSSYAFVAVALFLILAWRKPGLRVAGAALMPLAFLALGGAMMAPKSELAVTGTLASYWLVIHVAFAKLSYGSFITAFGLSVMYLVRKKRGEADDTTAAKLVTFDDLSFKFVAAGFIFLGIMIAAGAIWANESWGRYWAWDPIETWSLISWLCYSFVIHLRVTMGWRDSRFAWAAIAALPVLLFAMIGVVIVYQSIHGAYLIGF